MKNSIYHNPRCSKSRQTMALLEEKGQQLEVVEYLKAPPTKEELDWICTALNIEPLQLMRTKEATFKELGLNKKDQRPREEWLTFMSQHPILIERPIVIYNEKAALGRPPENILTIL